MSALSHNLQKKKSMPVHDCARLVAGSSARSNSRATPNRLLRAEVRALAYGETLAVVDTTAPMPTENAGRFPFSISGSVRSDAKPFWRAEGHALKGLGD